MRRTEWEMTVLAKRGCFALLTGLLVVVVLEIGAFAVLSVTEGRVVSLSSLADLRERAKAASVAIEPQTDREPAAKIDLRTVLHPYLGYVADPFHYPTSGRPRFSREAATFGFPQNWYSPFRQPQPGRVVVAVFGGSVANGVATGPRFLEKALASSGRFAGRQVEVVSLALGAYKQPQHLNALTWVLGLGAHFDLVITIDGFNEVAVASASVAARGVYPFYPRGWELKVDDLAPELREAQGEIAHLRRRRVESALLFSSPPFRWSYVAGTLWRALDRRTAASQADVESAVLDGVEGASGSYQATGPPFAGPIDDDQYRRLAEHWARCSLMMHRVCEGAAIEYHHVLQPNQYVPGSKPLSEQELAQAWRERHPYRAPVVEGYPHLLEAGEWLAERGVRFHDLTQVFAGREETLYGDACCHPNQVGYRLLADAIVQRVEQAGPAAPPDRGDE